MPDQAEHMTKDERRRVLEEIARDPDAYPRDKISAIRELEMMDLESPQSGSFDDLDELDQRRRRYKVKQKR
jgi:hypothetical protein